MTEPVELSAPYKSNIIKSLGVTPLGRLLVLLGGLAGTPSWVRLFIYLGLSLGGATIWDSIVYPGRVGLWRDFGHGSWHLPWYLFLIWFTGVLDIKIGGPCLETFSSASFGIHRCTRSRHRFGRHRHVSDDGSLVEWKRA